ncbi:MAG: winged helix-turn-helix domain-containing protein [Promethearchaeota archaeon]
MSLQKKQLSKIDSINEDEIFKALGNKIRRNIIKILGNKGKISFTDILTNIGDIDSSKLSYHLRCLSGMVDQYEGQYVLTEIGNAAVSLMNKIDQSEAIQKRKKKFMWANITSTIFLIFFIITISLMIRKVIPENFVIWLLLILNIFAQANQQVIWYLYRKSYSLPSWRTQIYSFFTFNRSGKRLGKQQN